MSNTLFTSNVCFIYGYYSKVPKALNIDPYWGIQEVYLIDDNDNKKTYEAALCLNQKGFKKFVKACRFNINFQHCWSDERYPSKYPCIVQLWKHFEGGMIYVDINYIVPEKYHKYLKEKEKWYPKENELCLFKMKDNDKWYLDKFEAGDIYDKNSVIKSVGLNPNGSPYWDEIKQYKNTEFYND